MQPKFTLTRLGSNCMRLIAIAIILISSTQFSLGQQTEAKAPNKLKAQQQVSMKAKLDARLQAKQGFPQVAPDNDAGLPNKVNVAPTSPNKTEVICSANVGVLQAGDLTFNTRPFRDGVLPPACTNKAGCTAGIAAAGSFYDVYTFTNPLGSAQCVTLTYNVTAINPAASFTFVTVHNGTYDPTNNCTNWISDPGTSPTTGIPVTWSFSLAGNATATIVVSSVGVITTANYTLDIDAPVCTSGPCSGTPAPGNTISSVATVCPGIGFTLSLQNNTPGAGVTYQWEIAATAAGPWSTIVGATNSTYTATQSTPNCYRCKVTCAGNTGISTPVCVASTPPASCYCAAGAIDVIDEKISNVTYGTINNNSSSQAGYENFLNVSTQAIKGSSLPFSVSASNFFAGDLIKIWIDFNQNGNFTDAGENVFAAVTSATPFTGTITVPTGAATGNTRMRVRLYWQPSDGNPGPCGDTGFGQVEDYTVNIQPCIPGLFTTIPVSASTLCGGGTTFTAAATGSLISIRWQYKIGANWFDIVNGNDPNGGTYAGAATGTLTLTNATVAMNGRQYRALMSGPCTGIDFSSPPATLTVNPLVATVNPPSANICIGSIQQLSITNTASAPTTTTFSSGTLNTIIPDNNQAGISNVIAVSGIPAGATITGIAVKLNVGHTWPGDLCMVLKNSVSGAVLNLNFFLTGTGAGPGTGFVNTQFSSATGLGPIGAAANPFTGIFAPDGALVGTPPPGPTGFAPTTATFTGMGVGGLGTGVNGNWTFAVYDGFALDQGTLQNWSIDISYVAPVPATGIWTSSPAAPNTMFINAAATTPYVAGTPVTTIWVNPTVNTNYSVVVTTPLCTTAPTVVPVTVFTPLSNLSAPANKSACVGSTTTFSVTGNGGPLSYQWQVSIDNGLTYSNIAGATGATLTLTNVLQTMNNNKYRVNVASGPCNSATSSVAILTVNPLPIVTVTATDLSLVPGGTSTVSATSVPAALNATSYSWTLNGATIAGANTNSVVANIDKLGTYVASVTDVNGCTNSSSIIIGTEASDRLWIYPNPSPDGAFQVRLYHRGDLSERRIVTVYTSQGILVAKKEFNQYNTNSRYQSMTFNLPALAAGTYVVKVVNKFAENVAAGILVIQR